MKIFSKFKQFSRDIKAMIIGALIMSCIGVYAAGECVISASADDVSYNNTTVQAAIDDLYARSGVSLFYTDSWETIISNVKNGDTSRYNVGDTKKIDLGQFGTHTVRIVNMSTPSDCNSAGFSQSACGFVIEFTDIIRTYNMNPTATNAGGWPASAGRSYLNSSIYGLLPAELKKGIINTTVVSGHGSTTGESNFTSSDKLYLLSSEEISSYVSGSASSYTRRLDYYSTHNNDSDRVKNGNWWLRTPHPYSNSAFINVTSSGSINTSNLISADSTEGLSPAFRIGSSFETDDWYEIAANIRNGNTSQYEVGDTREIDMGSFGTHTIRISNKSTPSDCSTTGFSQTACGFVVEFADIITEHRMNPYDGSSTSNGNGSKGGWRYSEARSYINSTLYNALPIELRNVILDTTVVSGHGSDDSSNFTTTDKLYLLDTKELWNSNPNNYNTAADKTRQLDYYSNIGVTSSNYSEAIKKYNSTDSIWWLRNARSNGGNDFYRVHASGAAGYAVSTNTYGFSPVFRIG